MAIAEQELGIRLSREQQERLRQAASLAGLSVDDFAASALVRAADAVLASSSVTVLSARDFDCYLALRDAEVLPAPALAQAAEEYKRRLADGSLQVED